MSSFVYFDSCVFLDWLLEKPNHMEAVDALLEQARHGHLTIRTSTLTIAEVLYVKGRERIPVEDREVVRELFDNDWIETQSVTRDIAEMAQELHWDYRVKPKDCIHVATALFTNTPTLYTYDKEVLRLRNLETEHGTVTVLKPAPLPQMSLGLPDDN